MQPHDEKGIKRNTSVMKISFDNRDWEAEYEAHDETGTSST